MKQQVHQQVMENNFYTSYFEKYSGKLSKEIESAIEVIRNISTSQDPIIVYNYGIERIAIRIEINIQLPSLGPVNNVDIREMEPILIIFNLQDYPFKTPRVASDRKDFPHKILPHLYAKSKGKPAILCLTRGSSDDWFATQKIESVIIKAKNWFKDAAAGFLVQDNEQFDPIRIENYSGLFTYSYDEFIKIITTSESLLSDTGLTILLLELNKRKKLSYRYSLNVPENIFDQIKLSLQNPIIQ